MFLLTLDSFDNLSSSTFLLNSNLTDKWDMKPPVSVLYIAFFKKIINFESHFLSFHLECLLNLYNINIGWDSMQ